MRSSTLFIPPALAMPPTDPTTYGKYLRTIGASVDGKKLPYSESTVVQSLDCQLNRIICICVVNRSMPADIVPVWGQLDH